MNALSLYLRYSAASLRSQLQYRASFIMQAIGAFLITGIEFVGIWALFDRFGQLRGWSLPEVALFYGMISVTFAISDSLARGFDLFGTMVKAGDFDRILLRPRSTVLQLLGQEITLRRVGRLAQGAIILIWAILVLDLSWTGPRLALLLATICGGVCLFMGLVILQATSAFWTTESLEVWNAFTYGGVTMSQYPVAIYRPWFRRFFTFVIPLACVNYLPGVAILGRADPLGSPPAAQWLAPLAGPAFLLVCLQIWKIGVRHYRSTGS
jgi:ABC-2 type transport system permease protein